MNNNQLWQAVLGELELTLSKANFTTWFRGTFVISINYNKIIIGVPNTFTKAWLEKKFKKYIFDILDKLTNNLIKEIEFVVGKKTEQNFNTILNETQENNSFVIREKNKQSNDYQNFNNQNQIYQSPPQPPKNDFYNSAFKKDFQKIENFNPNYTSPNVNSFQVQNTAQQNYSVLPPFELNPKYSFQNFIVGKCNELAHAAAKAVANNPGKNYNPLFIYGGVGLGKTHLLQAIGNLVKQQNQSSKILYVSCEKFTNDFIKAIKSGKTDGFKNIYRTVDLLLIDDVQFLASKETTQEEFFHTFNELHQKNKQLVVTSDRPPKSIPELENRLLSRFEWGMIADVSPVDYETRLAILETKCTEKNLLLNKEILEYIARSIQDNVREIEGVLNRIKAHIEFQNIVADIHTIKNILTTINNSTRKDLLSPQKILRTVALFFNITLEELVGKNREKKLVYPRQIAMFLLREELQASYPLIGKELGGRDHTTAMHACQKMTQDIEDDEKIKQDFNLIKQRLFAK